MSLRDLGLLAGLLFFIALMLGTCAWNYSVWTECRENGSSVMYCLRMVMR